MKKVNLSQFTNTNFLHGRSKILRLFWMIVSIVFFESMVPYPYSLKVKLLKLFGARVGHGLILKPSVKIKQPWCLEINDHCWIGEGVWIDNLVLVKLGSHVCLSQGSFLFTGNHNYKITSFNLITDEIYLEDGVWIGAKAIVGPGVRCFSHAILTAGSTTFSNLEGYGIYQGNPAVLKRKRNVS